MVRLALAWTAGGMYSDTDVICIKPVASLQNVLGLSDDYKLINNGVFHFHKRHPLLRVFMETIAKNFKVGYWSLSLLCLSFSYLSLTHFHCMLEYSVRLYVSFSLC